MIPHRQTFTIFKCACPGEIANILDRRWVDRVESCPYVFHRDGQRIKHDNPAWRTAQVKAGLLDKFFHDACRTAVWNVDRAGVPRQTAKQITRHKTDVVYNRYRIVNEQDIREGMKKACRAQSRHIPASDENTPPTSS